MTVPSPSLSDLKMAVLWAIGLGALSSVLVHAEYALDFSEWGQPPDGAWFLRNRIMFEGHMALVFAPSAVLAWQWWRSRMRWVHLAFACSFALWAYETWLPPGLAALNALDLYPPHRQAFFERFGGVWKERSTETTAG